MPGGGMQIDVFINPPVVIQGTEEMLFEAEVYYYMQGMTFTYEWLNENTGDILGSDSTLTLQSDLSVTTTLKCTVTAGAGVSGSAKSIVLVTPTANEFDVFVDPPITFQRLDPLTFAPFIHDPEIHAV